MNQIEQLAAEVASARGEARTALEFVRGTPNFIGLRERVQANEDALNFQRDREQERWQSIDEWFGKLENRLITIERRQVHPSAVWLLVLFLGMASSAACWSVWGPRIREEYALIMGCDRER